MGIPVRLTLALLAVSSCRSPQTDTERERTPPAWHLSQPVASVGVAEGEESYELSQATSSLRLSDGRLVIANSGSHQLRVFDSLGRFLTVIGRKGSGPGEFEGSLQLRSDGAGGFTVYDGNLQRLSRFDTSGSLLSEARIASESSSEFPLTTWLHRLNWIDGPVDTTARSLVAALLDGLETPAPGGYRLVKVGEDGHVWTQLRASDGPAGAWRVYELDGTPLAIVTIPEELEIHHVGAEFMTARSWDSTDVERIQVYRIEGPSNLVATRFAEEPAAGSLPRISREIIANLMREVRNMVMVQEMHYADHNGYATKTADLAAWEPPAGMAFHLMAADRRGWVGVMVSRSAPVLCGMAVGGSTPPGWQEGGPKCSPHTPE